MKLGVFTQWIAADSIEALAQRIKALDLQCVVLDSYPGLSFDPDTLTSEHRRRIKAAFAAAGVEIAAVGYYCNLAHPDPVERQEIQRRFHAMIQFCVEVGAPMLCTEAGTLHAADEWAWDPANALPETFDAFVEELRPLADTARSQQILLGIEPYVMTIIHTPERAAQLIERLQNPYVRLVADPAGSLTRETLNEQETFLPQAFERIGPYLGLVHVEDCRPDPDGHFFWLPAGQGLINYPLFMDQVVAAGYRGPLILEHLSETSLPLARDFVRTQWAQALQRVGE